VSIHAAGAESVAISTTFVFRRNAEHIIGLQAAPNDVCSDLKDLLAHVIVIIAYWPSQFYAYYTQEIEFMGVFYLI